MTLPPVHPNLAYSRMNFNLTLDPLRILGREQAFPELEYWLVIFGYLNMIKLLLSTQTFDFILNSILKFKTPNIVRLI